MATSWVVLLDSYDPHASLITFGLCAIVAGALASALPETNSRKIPDTVEESEDFKYGGPWLAKAF
jgi:hypothetical protein